MKHLKWIGAAVGVAALSAGVSCFCFKKFGPQETIVIEKQAPVQYSSYNNGGMVDFTQAAETSVNAVVHVMTIIETRQSNYSNYDPFLEFFFGERGQQRQAPRQQQMGSGSGVILSSDGYIVTNNHVVDGSNNVKVVLNDKREFNATIVGTDPNTDLALLKIEATDLPALRVGNSDDLKVGEWVLAVGNPFNLTSTVTAGIVSAKARNINILTSDMKIESFIQTDAAVNPGNSGGALVNTNGELVGINAAIASQTGSYSGYSFAIPTSIMSKVVADLKEFGTVQRALLGVKIQDINADLAKEKNLDMMEGAYVAEVGPNSAAAEAGIESGDIITHINGHKVKSVSETQDQISRFRPGDKVEVVYQRGSKQKKTEVTLKNMNGDTSMVKQQSTNTLGAKLTPLSEKKMQQMRLSGGLEVSQIEKGGKFHQAGIPNGYIIVRVNNISVNSTSDIDRIISNMKGQEEQALFLSGVMPNGKVVYFAVDMN
ncbi:MAG: Do family serine endopeptidase [Paludibacteraceae bacterium]|nr:Do family serine endopeptidase [Paludibacteraceae bacterium]